MLATPPPLPGDVWVGSGGAPVGQELRVPQRGAEQGTGPGCTGCCHLPHEPRPPPNLCTTRASRHEQWGAGQLEKLLWGPQTCQAPAPHPGPGSIPLVLVRRETALSWDQRTGTCLGLATAHGPSHSVWAGHSTQRSNTRDSEHYYLYCCVSRFQRTLFLQV